jgi:hypothetical protein
MSWRDATKDGSRGCHELVRETDKPIALTADAGKLRRLTACLYFRQLFSAVEKTNKLYMVGR